jgi:hypothetical protein
LRSAFETSSDRSTPILFARISGNRTSFATPSGTEEGASSVVIVRIWSTPSLSTIGGSKSLPAPASAEAPEPRAAVEYAIACRSVRVSMHRSVSTLRPLIDRVAADPPMPPPTWRTPSPSRGSQSL